MTALIRPITAEDSSVVRLPDWHERLIAYCLAHEKCPFQYGSADCWCFAKGGIFAMTGQTILPQFGGYTNRFGMLRMLRRCGYRSLAEAAHTLAPTLGWPTIHESDADIGDIALMPGDPVSSLGIVCADGVIMQALDGLVAVPQGHAIATWRLPYVA